MNPSIGRHPECGSISIRIWCRASTPTCCSKTVQYMVEDLGSGNGTYRQRQADRIPTALKHDDRIKLGPILLRFESDASDGQKNRTNRRRHSRLVATIAVRAR